MFRKRSKILKIVFVVGAMAGTANFLRPAPDYEARSSEGKHYPSEQLSPFASFFANNNSTEELFDLEHNIPLAKDAKHVFAENPEMVYVGIYDAIADEVTLMPALPDSISVTYDKNHIISGITPRRSRGSKPPSEDEIAEIKKEENLYVPRIGQMPDKISRSITGHEYMLMHMGVPLSGPFPLINALRALFVDHPYIRFYGFAVTRKNESIAIDPVSRTLNMIGKPGFPSFSIPRALVEKLEKRFYEWIHTNEANQKTNHSEGLLTIPNKK